MTKTMVSQALENLPSVPIPSIANGPSRDKLDDGPSGVNGAADDAEVEQKRDDGSSRMPPTPPSPLMGSASGKNRSLDLPSSPKRPSTPKASGVVEMKSNPSSSSASASKPSQTMVIKAAEVLVRKHHHKKHKHSSHRSRGGSKSGSKGGKEEGNFDSRAYLSAIGGQGFGGAVSYSDPWTKESVSFPREAPSVDTLADAPPVAREPEQKG